MKRTVSTSSRRPRRTSSSGTWSSTSKVRPLFSSTRTRQGVRVELKRGRTLLVEDQVPEEEVLLGRRDEVETVLFIPRRPDEGVGRSRRTGEPARSHRHHGHPLPCIPPP